MVGQLSAQSILIFFMHIFILIVLYPWVSGKKVDQADLPPTAVPGTYSNVQYLPETNSVKDRLRVRRKQVNMKHSLNNVTIYAQYSCHIRSKKYICVFQVSRLYLGFCPDPKHFIVNYEQNVVKFAEKWGKNY